MTSHSSVSSVVSVLTSSLGEISCGLQSPAARTKKAFNTEVTEDTES